MAKTHRLDPTPETVHWGYLDAKIPARMEVQSGDTVVVDTVSGWQEVAPDPGLYSPAHAEIIGKLKPVMGPHILTGPIAVRGAEPGDTLEVRIKAIELTADWGWNIMRPLRGTLPEDFPEFQARVIPIDRERMTAKLAWGPTIPLQPFFGIIATAPRPEYGRLSSVEPREFGGNIDCKEFVPGTSLFLPVFVPGANLSAGDGHAVQGDGEVDLTALESFLEKTARFRVPILGGIWPLYSLANAEFMHNEVPGASVPPVVMERMRRAQDKGPEFARREGVEIAREVLQSIKGMVQGVQVSPPFGKCELALEVLEGL